MIEYTANIGLEMRIYRALNEVCNAARTLKQTICYEDAATAHGLIARHSKVGQVMERMVFEDMANGRPIRTSVIVLKSSKTASGLKDGGMPSGRFLDYLGELGMAIPDDEKTRQELVRLLQQRFLVTRP